MSRRVRRQPRHRWSRQRPSLVLAGFAGVALLLSGSSCEYTVRETSPDLMSRAEDAVGSLSAENPPVLRVTVTQEGQPVEDADVTFIALDEDGDELGNIGFVNTDANGVASVTLVDANRIVLEDVFAAARYAVDVTSPDFAQGGTATADLRVTR